MSENNDTKGMQETVRKENNMGVMKTYVRTDIGTSVVETPKRIKNPVTERTEDLTNLSADGYCRRFLALLSASSGPNVVNFNSSPVATFDKERWELQETDSNFVMVKREPETELDEMVVGEK